MIGEILIQIFFGWPMIIASILIAALGVWRRKPILLVLAGIACLPFTYYLSGFRTPAVILPFFLFGSAYAVSRQKTLFAWLLVAPLAIIAIMLAYAVLTQ